MLLLQKTVSFPARALHAPTESHECLADTASAQPSTSGCAGSAQPSPPGCCLTPRAPRHSPEHCSANLAATQITSQELQPLGGSRLEMRKEQGFFLRSGCSRSQLFWSSYPGHNSGAAFPAAPGNASSRKQQRAPWNTRLWSSSQAGWLAGTPEPKAGHASPLPSLLPRSWDTQWCPEPAPPRAGRSSKAGTRKSSRSLHKESVRSYLSRMTGPRGRTETWEALPGTTGW